MPLDTHVLRAAQRLCITCLSSTIALAAVYRLVVATNITKTEKAEWLKDPEARQQDDVKKQLSNITPSYDQLYKHLPGNEWETSDYERVFKAQIYAALTS